MVLQADCVPILFYDPNKKVIGIAHAGWKGTVSKIARNTVNAMNKNYNSKPKDIIAGIGPAIGPCCYEVKLDVVKKVEKSLDNGKEIIIVRDGKYYLDLWKANSSRASKNAAGRFGAGIMICD
jgi:YfiH family protein